MDCRVEYFVLRLAWEDLPPHIQEQMRMCGVDLFGALILGCKGKQFEAGVALAKQLGLTGTLVVPGAPQHPFNLFGAVMAISHAANSFDIDDGFNLVKGHPGASFVAGALAGGLEQKCSYTEYLTCLAACYEGALRWALAMQDHYGYLHSTGAYGAFGTALALGKMRGLSAEQLNNALSIADFHAPFVPVMRSVEMPSMNKDGVPFGSMVGALAVLETLQGVTGKRHLLEFPEYNTLVDSLGAQWYVTELYFKPYTCCRWAHQPITACLELMRCHDITHDQVEAVCVHTFEAAARLFKGVPTTTDEAQYNIAYPVAAALVHGDVGYAQINDDALSDVSVLDMMNRLTFDVDASLEERFPEERLAWVQMTLRDGRVLESRICAASGEKDDPAVNLDWICEKFLRITKPVLRAADQHALLDSLARGDEPLEEVVARVNSALR